MDRRCADIYSSFGFASVFGYLVAVLTAGALILLRWGERTSRRSLEQIAP